LEVQQKRMQDGHCYELAANMLKKINTIYFNTDKYTPFVASYSSFDCKMKDLCLTFFLSGKSSGFVGREP